jgi:uncharacterized protein DUF6158
MSRGSSGAVVPGTEPVVEPRRSGYPTAMATIEGVPAGDLSDEDLFRELTSLHRTRLDTLRHAPDDALEVHLARTAELEQEYLHRRPEREIDPRRLTISTRS